MSFTRFFLLIAGVALLAETGLLAEQKPFGQRFGPIVRPVPARPVRSRYLSLRSITPKKQIAACSKASR